MNRLHPLLTMCSLQQKEINMATLYLLCGMCHLVVEENKNVKSFIGGYFQTLLAEGACW
jgi:hypothetical protein